VHIALIVLLLEFGTKRWTSLACYLATSLFASLNVDLESSFGYNETNAHHYSWYEIKSSQKTFVSYWTYNFSFSNEEGQETNFSPSLLQFAHVIGLLRHISHTSFYLVQKTNLILYFNSQTFVVTEYLWLKIYHVYEASSLVELWCFLCTHMFLISPMYWGYHFWKVILALNDFFSKVRLPLMLKCYCCIYRFFSSQQLG